VRGAVDADGLELALAEVIDREVVRDLEEPARELELGAVAIDVIEDLDEGLLREVLGGLAIAHHAEDQREDGPLVAPHELAERGVAPRPRERGEIRVREIDEIEMGRGGHRSQVMAA